MTLSQFSLVSALILAVTCSIPATLTQAAWTPPIGVPDPGFGIHDVRPARPTNWSSAVAGYYYVNHETGTDNNNPYGTPAAPRWSIPRPVPKGSYVEVHGAYYYEQQGSGWIQANGTSDPWVANVSGPVWIVGESLTNKPVFTTLGYIAYGTNVFLELLDFKDGGSLDVGSMWGTYPARNIAVRSCVFEGKGTETHAWQPLATSGGEATPSQNILFYSNLIQHCGMMNPTNDTDVGAIVVGEYISNVWVLDNEMHTISERAMQIGGARYGVSRPENTHHIYVGRNNIHNIHHTGLWVKYASDVIYSQNELYDFRSSPFYGGDVSTMGAQYGPVRLWMIYNRIHDIQGGGIAVVSTDNFGEMPIYVIGNVIYNTYDSATDYTNPYSLAGVMIRGGTSAYVVNNTLFNAGGGIFSPTGPSRITISDNIVMNLATNNSTFVNMTGMTTNKAIRNNIFFESNSNARFYLDASYAGVSSINGLSAAITGNAETNALFVSSAYSNFHLSANSPAIDAGQTEDVYQTYRDLYGLDIRRDIEGVVRPQGGAWDLGAYEWTPGRDDGIIVGWDSIHSVAFYPQSVMNDIGEFRWYFEHASVGQNMRDGVDSLNSLSNTFYKLRKIYQDQDSSPSSPPSTTTNGTVYCHWRGNPGSPAKIALFTTSVSNGWRFPKVNLAMNKFCYIDYPDFNAYVASMTNLESRYPETVFVYCTKPITTSANVDTRTFNNTLRTWARANKRVLLDIADIEAHDTNGVEYTSLSYGLTCQVMYAGNTSDGGHLNAFGSQEVAKGFYAVCFALLQRDRDGDGMSDGHELIAGTCPTTANSCFQLRAPSNTVGGRVVSWPSVSNRTYVIERATNLLSGGFTTLRTNAATPPMNCYTDGVMNAGAYFYRARVSQ